MVVKTEDGRRQVSFLKVPTAQAMLHQRISVVLCRRSNQPRFPTPKSPDGFFPMFSLDCEFPSRGYTGIRAFARICAEWALSRGALPVMISASRGNARGFRWALYRCISAR